MGNLVTIITIVAASVIFFILTKPIDTSWIDDSDYPGSH